MALLFFSMTKLPNSILMFCLHEMKLNANILSMPPTPFLILPEGDSFTAMQSLSGQ